MKKLLVVLIAICTQMAYGESIIINKDIQVRDSRTERVSLKSRRYIKNIIIQAEGIRNDALVDVMVNGVSKGTIYAPAKDPSYIVTIEEETDSLEFRHIQGGTLRILSIVVNFTNINSEDETSKVFKSKVIEIATDTINLIEFLRTHSTIEKEEEYLMPIKISAGRIIVMSRAHGDLSIQTYNELEKLQSEIEVAKPYLDELLQTSVLFQ